MYAENEAIARQQAALNEKERTKDMIQQQDKIMTDAYGSLGQQGESHNDGESNNDENSAPSAGDMTD